MAQLGEAPDADDDVRSEAVPEVIGSSTFDGIEDRACGSSSTARSRASKAAGAAQAGESSTMSAMDFVGVLKGFLFYDSDSFMEKEVEDGAEDTQDSLLHRDWKKTTFADGAIFWSLMQQLFITGDTSTGVPPLAWVFVAVFVIAQLSSLALSGESFFGVMTGGIVESIREGQGLLVRIHIGGGVLMWSIAFLQIFFRKLRKEPYAIVHRLLGRIMLASWFFVMGPSCFILSLITSIGPHKRHFATTMFAIMSMDTTVFATFWYWRAWRVARERVRGTASFAVHGRAMQLGLLFTMTILMQRPMQLLFITIRKALTTFSEYVLPSWQLLAMLVDFLNSTFLDHHAILSATTFITGGSILMCLMDGPRSSANANVCWTPGEERREAYGGVEPTKRELWLWRTRYIVYLALRAMVTSCWTVDPITGQP